ncbi:MAG: carotenoid biosynthesis protein [Ardenticatenaceae bacterium]|nr:carotenoid biosynthesis protein [Anaerolineales bacterium]MCB8917038.1 carotenoid biosynthesis protein [Ardenticatenaceae bacterium]
MLAQREQRQGLRAGSLLARLGVSLPAGLLIVAWVLLMISVPIINWTLGQSAMRQMLVVSVVAQAAAVLAILQQAWGWARTLRLAAAVSLLTFLVEFLGSRTGFPFGPYSYTDLLQPQLGHVPLLIPLAWFMMLPAAWATVYHYRGRRLRFILLSAVALTAWDMLLDPQMVAWGLWVWNNPGGFFGIPWSNYAGWLLTAALLTWLLRPAGLPVRPLLFIYTITWFLESFGLAFFWGLPGPALAGGLLMGLFVLVGWWPVIAARPGEPSTQQETRITPHDPNPTP